MAIVQLTSSNPAFSFIIRKNPATGMLIREIRKGFGYGWFSDDNTYNAYFKDADNEVSYKRDKDEQFEYLNTTRYQSPMAVLNMMGEYFDTALKKRSEQDADGFTNQLRILLIHVPNDRYIRFFQNNFAGFTMEAWKKRKSHSPSRSLRTRVSMS